MSAPSGVSGVTPLGGGFEAAIDLCGARCSLGVYATMDEAATVYDKARAGGEPSISPCLRSPGAGVPSPGRSLPPLSIIAHQGFCCSLHMW